MKGAKRKLGLSPITIMETKRTFQLTNKTQLKSYLTFIIFFQEHKLPLKSF